MVGLHPGGDAVTCPRDPHRPLSHAGDTASCVMPPPGSAATTSTPQPPALGLSTQEQRNYNFFYYYYFFFFFLFFFLQNKDSNCLNNFIILIDFQVQTCSPASISGGQTWYFILSNQIQ